MRNMKNDFSVSLMKMLDKKPLEDITVTDIVNDCKVSRQTFYYHFNDIYTIVGWIYAQETQKALNDHLDINTWMTGCCNLLHWMEENRVLIINTHKSINREYTESFMNNVLFDYIYQMVDEQPDALLVSKNSKEFIAKYRCFDIQKQKHEVDKGLILFHAQSPDFVDCFSGQVLKELLV